jgi:hypothetical protein
MSIGEICVLPPRQGRPAVAAVSTVVLKTAMDECAGQARIMVDTFQQLLQEGAVHLPKLMNSM